MKDRVALTAHVLIALEETAEVIQVGKSMKLEILQVSFKFKRKNI